jgi:hypothetical protein
VPPEERESSVDVVKTAYLVVIPRVEENIAKLTDVIAVFSAAGSKIDIAIKEFRGHTMILATRGAEAGYDLVIGCSTVGPPST